MVEFFKNLTGFEAVLWFIAVPTSIIFLLQTLMIFFGLDHHDGDMSHDFDHDNAQQDTGKSFGWFSFKNLINFFVVFAWAGISCIHAEMSHGLSLLIATLSGISMMVIMTLLMRGMKKLSYDGSTKLSNAIGKEAVVYLAVPDHGKGKISMILGGSLQYLDATSETGTIARGRTVEVIGIKGDCLLVKRKEEVKQEQNNQ